MALEGPPIRGRQLLCRCGECGSRVAAIHEYLVALDGSRTDMAVEHFASGECLRVAPGCLEGFGRANRRPFVIGDDAEKVLYPYHTHIRDVSNRCFVHRKQFLSKRRRTNDAAM